MKSNLNTKILKLSIAEICIQLGFDKITEQSMNLLSDVLRYYIIQIWLKLGRYEQTNFYDIIIKNIFNDMLIAESYQEKELNIFTKAQNSVKKYYNENSNNKSLLHLLKILPNNQKFFNSNQNNNETHKNNFKQLSIEKNTKPQFFNEFREKDDILINFVEKCKTEFQKKNKTEKMEETTFHDIDFFKFIQENKKKRFEFNKSDFYKFLNKQNENFDIFEDLRDIFFDFTFLTNKKYVRTKSNLFFT